MKIKLDRTMCDGFGTCAVHAPNTFSLDEWGYVSLIGAGNIADEDEDGVRRALLDCPVHAIIELDAPGDQARDDRFLASQVGSASPRELLAAVKAGERLIAETAAGGTGPKMTNPNPFG